MRRFFTLLFLVLISVSLAYSGNVKGIVKDADTGDPLIGANVILEGTTIGASTDMDGFFIIQNVPEGNYVLKVIYVGYDEFTQPIAVGAEEVSLKIELKPTFYMGKEITVFADRAKPRETPVAFTDVSKKEIITRLGSRDIPLVLNVTPSVYATMQGGGAGDARINVRGFNQRNVAIMINGVPVNDMENGWVYWSNWDGVGDATSSIQVQRGLSAVNLATPSIGGTMNVITDPTAQDMGFTFKQEVGDASFLKSTFIGHSGLINNQFALSGVVVRKTGNGVINKTWTDAWAYYFGASFIVNKNNRLELYALGAPQRHGQNLYKQNIGTYDHDYAKDIKRKESASVKISEYDTEAFGKFVEKGRTFNQNWSPVSSKYTGKQWFNGSTHDRYDANFINERENYYHKPIVNLNWYSSLTEKLDLYSTVYYSGGKGGGTGTYGKLYRRDANGELGDDDYKFYYGPSPWTWDWNKTIEANSGPAGTYYVDKKAIDKENGESIGILRNSVNQQWTIGAISKAYYKVSPNMKINAGLDWRTAEIEHFREVRDLLGGNYYTFTGNYFDSPAQHKKKLGDKIDYYFTNKVDWLGGFGQVEYKGANYTTYGMAGYSVIRYKHNNHFKPDPADSTKELQVESDWISGLQVKGGASYLLSRYTDIYANVGYVQKVPIFDNVINDRTGAKAENPKSEKFYSYEAGVNYRGMNGKLTTKVSLYHTIWKDRAYSRGITNPDGSEGLIFLTGMNTIHQGIEFEAAFKPTPYARFDAAASFGNWKLTDNVVGTYKDYTTGGAQDVEYKYYVKNLKVGDAPQTQVALAGSVYPIKGLMMQLVGRYYNQFYADWDPFSRTDENDTDQSWQAPAYTVFDFHASYELPVSFKGIGMELYFHLFNIFDSEYIQDAVDNSRYNAWDYDHDADDAEVFFGLPRTFNTGLQFKLK